MFDYMLSPEQLQLLKEVRGLINWVPRQMILDMDRDKIQFPKAFLQEAGRRVRQEVTRERDSARA